MDNLYDKKPVDFRFGIVHKLTTRSNLEDKIEQVVAYKIEVQCTLVFDMKINQ